MAKQNPDLFLIKIGDGADPVVYSNLCGLASRSLTVGGDAVDVTTIDCAANGTNAWADQAHGIRSMSVSGSGYFENKTQTASLIDNKLAGDGIDDFTVVVPGLGSFVGRFLIGELGIAAEVGGGAVSMDMSLSSTGTVVFTAEA
jgi:predicted secreted protein